MGTGTMKCDAYGGVVVKKRPPPIHAVRFTGTNLTHICRWLELRANWSFHQPRTEMYPGDAHPMLVLNEQRFCAGDWLVSEERTISRYSDEQFQRTFEAAFEAIE